MSIIFISPLQEYRVTQKHDRIKVLAQDFYCNGVFLWPSPQMLENQVEVRQREVVELQSQVKALGQEVKDTDEVDGRRQLLERKFQELLDPLRRRKNFLVASREVHQFNRDVEDEIVRKTDRV